MWTELEGWTELYDVNALAGALKDDEWARFERVVTETIDLARPTPSTPVRRPRRPDRRTSRVSTTSTSEPRCATSPGARSPSSSAVSSPSRPLLSASTDSCVVPTATEPTPAPRPSGEVGAIPEAATPVVTLEDRALPHTTDPIAYARAVATSLFDWDTSLGFLPTDYTAAVLADADPSGEETPGLIADVATYLPTVDQWLDLGAMEVRQTIEIDDAYVPESWTAAVAASPRPPPTGHDGRDRHRHPAPERRVERRGAPSRRTRSPSPSSSPASRPSTAATSCGSRSSTTR